MLILRPILLTAVILSLTASIAADESPATDPPSASEFIRNSCQSTQYPDVCYRSLSSHAGSVQNDPARLAMAAIGVSLSRATRMSVYLANLTRHGDIAGASAAASDPRAAAALRDCNSVFGDAVEQMRGSMKQMRQLSVVGEELRFQMSNVQTWMSAALTNEETCTDGFDEVADGPMKADVCDRTVEVKEVTSNALALVNNYAANCQG